MCHPVAGEPIAISAMLGSDCDGMWGGCWQSAGSQGSPVSLWPPPVASLHRKVTLSFTFFPFFIFHVHTLHAAHNFSRY